MELATTGSPSHATTTPVFLDEATQIASTLAMLSPTQLTQVMNASPAIVNNVHTMYANWRPDGQGKPALWTYRGDVYKGLYADHLSPADAEWAEEHLLILSGLYGLLRPHDAIQRYRLEMKAPLAIGMHRNLYEFWGDTLAKYVTERATDNTVVCLSSDEYAKAVLRHLPKHIRVITPVFYDNRPNGTIGTAPIYNKMMRGVVTRWLVDHRVDTPEGLQDFTGHGYAYDPSRSTPDRPAYFRPVMRPLVFDRF